MKIIAITNQKGGVGKTTTAINLAAGLAKLGKRVCVVDLDPQRNATTSLHRRDYQGVSINDLIYCGVAGVPCDEAPYIFHNEVEGVDYIPATPVLSSAPALLASCKDSSLILAGVLRRDYFRDRYDFILLDCKPSLDLLVVNALAASDQIIIPTEPEDYAVDGIADLMESVERMQSGANEGLTINGILITKAATTRKKTGRVESQLRALFGNLVYDTVIPNLADAGKAQDMKCSMVNLPGSRLGEAYRNVAKEVLKR